MSEKSNENKQNINERNLGFTLKTQQTKPMDMDRILGRPKNASSEKKDK